METTVWFETQLYSKLSNLSALQRLWYFCGSCSTQKNRMPNDHILVELILWKTNLKLHNYLMLNMVQSFFNPDSLFKPFDKAFIFHIYSSCSPTGVQ